VHDDRSAPSHVQPGVGETAEEPASAFPAIGCMIASAQSRECHEGSRICCIEKALLWLLGCHQAMKREPQKGLHLFAVDLFVKPTLTCETSRTVHQGVK